MIDRLGGTGSRDVDEDFDDVSDFDPSEPPPSPVGQMSAAAVRAYNHWASLLGEFDLPLVADLDPDALPDFGFFVLARPTGGIDDLQLRCGARAASEG